MTTTGTTMYCRHCGVAIGPGLAYCGRCGTPVLVAAPVAPTCARCGAAIATGAGWCGRCGAPAQAVASWGGAAPVAPPGEPTAPPVAPQSFAPPPPPVWGAAPAAPTAPPSPVAPPWGAGPYAAPAPVTATGPGWGTSPAPLPGAAVPAPGAARLGRRGRLPAIVKFGIVAVVLVIIGSVAASVSQGASARCVYSCTPGAGVALPTGNVFTSPDGFGFGYPAGWSRASIGQPYVAAFEKGSTDGLFLIEGGRGTPSLSSLSQAGAQAVSSKISQIQDIGPVPGAKLGDQPGTGTFYGGVIQANGQQIPIRAAVVSAEQNGRWATFIGFGPFDKTVTPTGLLNDQDFDDILTQWSWSGS